MCIKIKWYDEIIWQVMHQTNFVNVINLCCKSRVCSYVYFSSIDNDIHMFENSTPQETLRQVLI